MLRQGQCKMPLPNALELIGRGFYPFLLPTASSILQLLQIRPPSPVRSSEMLGRSLEVQEINLDICQWLRDLVCPRESIGVDGDVQVSNQRRLVGLR